MSNDLLIEEPAEQTSGEQSSDDHAPEAALAAMPVISLSSSTDTSQDSDNKDSSSESMSRKPMSITIDIDDAAAKERRQIEELDFRFLCIDLRTLPGYLQFLTCCGGVFFFFVVYGYCQELIFTVEGFKPFGWYLTLVQFALYSSFAVVEVHLNRDRKRRIPFKTYLLIAFLTVATMGLSNSSLGYLNYPTQVIFKCCKLIPVLIGGILIQDKKFTIIDWIACVLMSIGLIFFTLADSSVSPSFSLYGVFLISMALCADAVIGNVQEKAIKHFSAPNAEVVLYSYSIGFLYILLGQIVTAQLWEAVAFCFKNPVVYAYIFLFSLSGYFGVNVVLNLVKMYGALIAVTVTTCRKGVTMVLSFLLFTKPFTMQYVWSGFIVLVGIYLNVYSKNRAQFDARFKDLVLRMFPRPHRLVALQNLHHVV